MIIGRALTVHHKLNMKKNKIFSAQGVFEMTRNELLVDGCKANTQSII